jgi:hypothetical protein
LEEMDYKHMRRERERKSGSWRRRLSREAPVQRERERERERERAVVGGGVALEKQMGGHALPDAARRNQRLTLLVLLVQKYKY